MLAITMKNGGSHLYLEEKYTDYEYMKDIFVVLKDSKWIGIYNMECVESVEVYEDPADCRG